MASGCSLGGNIMYFYNEVLNVLKSDERFFSDDGQLLRNAVYEAAMQMDAKLIKALYANEETRKHFFTDVDGIAVFDKVVLAGQSITVNFCRIVIPVTKTKSDL